MSHKIHENAKQLGKYLALTEQFGKEPKVEFFLQNRL